MTVKIGDLEPGDRFMLTSAEIGRKLHWIVTDMEGELGDTVLCVQAVSGYAGYIPKTKEVEEVPHPIGA